MIIGCSLFFFFPENEWDFLKGYVENKEIRSFELRYTLDEIATLQEEPFETLSLKYFPCLLLEVKYNFNGTTLEDQILWSLTDGEMILNTQSWTLSHGFSELIQLGLNGEEVAALQDLTKSASPLLAEESRFPYALSSLKKKNLVLETDGYYTLHMKDPFLSIPPRTRMLTPLVLRHYQQKEMFPKKFTTRQVERLVVDYFKPFQLAIKNTRVIYLPVAELKRKNSDDSFTIEYLNCLTGDPIDFVPA
ncbi:MAG: hypothetical protein WDZ27_04185 [Waddliaceae bacterium]